MALWTLRQLVTLTMTSPSAALSSTTSSSSRLLSWLMWLLTSPASRSDGYKQYHQQQQQQQQQHNHATTGGLFPTLVAAVKQKLYHNPSPTNHHQHYDSSVVSRNDSSMPITSSTVILEPLPVGQPLLQPWQRLMVLSPPPPPSYPFTTPLPHILAPFYCFNSHNNHVLLQSYLFPIFFPLLFVLSGVTRDSNIDSRDV